MLILISSLYTPYRAENLKVKQVLEFCCCSFFLLLLFWFKTFLHEMVYVFWRVKLCRGNLERFWEQKMFKGSPVNFFVKTVSRGNAEQIYSNFPAKRLSIYKKKNCHTFNYLNDFHLIN